MSADATGAEIKGDPQPGDIVEVEGTVLEDGSFLAREIKNECQGDDHDDGDDNDDDDSDDSDHGDDDDSDHEDDHDGEDED